MEEMPTISQLRSERAEQQKRPDVLQRSAERQAVSDNIKVLIEDQMASVTQSILDYDAVIDARDGQETKLRVRFASEIIT